MTSLLRSSAAKLYCVYPALRDLPTWLYFRASPVGPRGTLPAAISPPLCLTPAAERCSIGHMLSFVCRGSALCAIIHPDTDEVQVRGGVRFRGIMERESPTTERAIHDPVGENASKHTVASLNLPHSSSGEAFLVSPPPEAFCAGASLLLF
mmetsp:Transcript_42448/g.78504  ORF Transcript_42448/g.78504 Transcript_42448/m.78504 type:complete len:151 (-) Transcript_42448:210-662(-)